GEENLKCGGKSLFVQLEEGRLRVGSNRFADAVEGDVDIKFGFHHFFSPHLSRSSSEENPGPSAPRRPCSTALFPAEPSLLPAISRMKRSSTNRTEQADMLPNSFSTSQVCANFSRGSPSDSW